MSNIKQVQEQIERPWNGRQLMQWLTSGFLGAALALGGMTLAKQTQPAPLVIQPPAATATPLPTATPSPVQVYVSGEVLSPAVYTLPPDAIVQDAIELAGGFTVQAEPNVVNLALPLREGMHIYVPSTAEAEEIDMMIVSAEPVSSGAGRTGLSHSESAGGLININRASQAELETLPGIGPSTAQKIIAFREDNGPFTTIEGIMDVAGIGPAKFEGVKDFITVEE